MCAPFFNELCIVTDLSIFEFIWVIIDLSVTTFVSKAEQSHFQFLLVATFYC